MAIQKTSRPADTQQPYGRLLVLMACCLTVALGGLSGVRPETILIRAVTAGIITALIARVVTIVFQTFYTEDDD
jgi:hypothetical protein